MDAIFRVIEWESQIQGIAVAGDNVIRYYNENPEKRDAHVEKLNKVRDSIIADNIPLVYKERMLGEINTYMERLNPRDSKDIKFTPLHEFLIFALTGYAAAQLSKEGFRNFEEGMAEGIKKVYNGGDSHG